MRIASLLLAFIAFAPPSAATESKVRSILTTPKSWTMYLEFTDARTPSDRAQKFVWRHFERVGKVWGRRIPPWQSATASAKSQYAQTASAFDGAIRS